MKEMLRFKNADFLETKEEDGGMYITAYAAMFGNIDSANEIIEQGAFEKTLKERAGRIAFCYQHDTHYPLGRIDEIKEDEKGLFVRVFVSASEPGIITKIKEKILRELSIGYRVINSKSETRDGINVEVLTELKLYEASLVTIAANPLAVITGMKSEDKSEYLLKEFDRIIESLRNETIKFDVEYLKAITFSVLNEPQKENHAVMSKGEIINLLTKN